MTAIPRQVLNELSDSSVASTEQPWSSLWPEDINVARSKAHWNSCDSLYIYMYDIYIIYVAINLWSVKAAWLDEPSPWQNARDTRQHWPSLELPWWGSKLKGTMQVFLGSPTLTWLPPNPGPPYNSMGTDGGSSKQITCDSKPKYYKVKTTVKFLWILGLLWEKFRNFQ